MLKENLKVSVLSGGFYPERTAALPAGRNIVTALQNSGFQHVNLIDVGTNIVDQLQTSKPDFAFVAMLCRWGEDGVIQSVLEALNIPYSGSGVGASAVSKDKYLFTLAAKGLGLRVPETTLYTSKKEAFDGIKNATPPEIFKPSYDGHSIGTTLVRNLDDYPAAIEEAFETSSRIVKQEFISGREFTVGILDIPNKESLVLPILELKFAQPFFSNEVKDSAREHEKIVPAELDVRLTDQLREEALKVYKGIGCYGVSRMDVILGEDQKFYFLENNTFPGIPTIERASIAMQLKAAGISMEQFVEYMVVTGLNRLPTKIDSFPDEES